MATPHIESEVGSIAKTVLMPGDPLRAKYIADTYLTDVKQINSVRNMLGYTGKYKGCQVSVFASGMGIPSMGIYAYELYQFYDVENIIRIGTAGSNQKDVKIRDIILADSSYSLSTFAYLFDGDMSKIMNASTELNQKIKKKANENHISLKEGMVLTSDVFNVYVNQEEYMKKFPSDLHTMASEMETFALFFMAKKLHKKASSLLTIVDSPYEQEEISSKDRQESLDTMIILALESCL